MICLHAYALKPAEQGRSSHALVQSSSSEDWFAHHSLGQQRNNPWTKFPKWLTTSNVSSMFQNCSQSCVSNQHWREPVWHEVMRSACWGNIVVWSLLGPLATEHTEWLRHASSEFCHMASEALKATTCLTRFINVCETFQELCCNPSFKDDQRDVKSCKA